MEYIKLGGTGIEVSRLCFGGLIIGPLQSDLPEDEGAEVIVSALSQGVNFIDTAEIYGTYSHIRRALKRAFQNATGNSVKKPVIASKSYAYSADGARKSLEKARKEMDIDVIDIFLMHEQESRLTLRGHREALEYYLNAKVKGIVKAVGVSTHNIEVVEVCAGMAEIDVIHPIVNIKGIGIGDGSINEMLTAVKKAFEAGKGVYSMKPLGGGNLIKSFNESMEFVLNIPFIHSVAVGMKSIDEVTANVSVFERREIPEQVKNDLNMKEKRIHIDYWCEACGKCVERCVQGALETDVTGNRILVKREKCILCGYCSTVCPVFAIKIF